jgi:hypothetical protein
MQLLLIRINLENTIIIIIIHLNTIRKRRKKMACQSAKKYFKCNSNYNKGLKPEVDCNEILKQ